MSKYEQIFFRIPYQSHPTLTAPVNQSPQPQSKFTGTTRVGGGGLFFLLSYLNVHSWNMTPNVSCTKLYCPLNNHFRQNLSHITNLTDRMIQNKTKFHAKKIYISAIWASICVIILVIPRLSTAGNLGLDKLGGYHCGDSGTILVHGEHTSSSYV